MNEDPANKDLLNISLIIDENNTTHIKINPKKNDNVDSLCGEVCKKYNLNEKVQEKLGKEIKKRIDGLMQNKIFSEKTINRLYYESIERNKEKEAFLDEMRRERESVILNKFSFTPNINKNSNLLYDRKHVKIEDKLYNEFKVIREKQIYERLISEISERNKADKNNVDNSRKKAKNSKNKIKGNSISTLKKINSLNDSDTNKTETNKNANKLAGDIKITDKLGKNSKEKIMVENEELKNKKFNKKDDAGIINSLNDLSEKVVSLNFEDLSLINKNKIPITDNSIEDSYLNLKPFAKNNLESSKEPEKKLTKKVSDFIFTPKNDLVAKTPAFFKNNIDSLIVDSIRLPPKKRNTYYTNNPDNLLSKLSKKFSFNNPNNERNSYLMRYKNLNAKSTLFSAANGKKSMTNLDNNINQFLNNFESFNLNGGKLRSNTINNTVNQFKLNLNTSGSLNKVFDVISEEDQINQCFNTMPETDSHQKDKETEFRKTLNTDNKKIFGSNKNLQNLQDNIFKINLNNNHHHIKNPSKQKDKAISNQEKTEIKNFYKGLESAYNLKYKSNIFDTAKKEGPIANYAQQFNKNKTALSSKQIGNYSNIVFNDRTDNNQFMDNHKMNLEAKTPLNEKKLMNYEIKEAIKFNENEKFNFKGNTNTIRLITENKSANNLSTRFYNTDEKVKSLVECDFVNPNNSNFNCLYGEEIKQPGNNYYVKSQEFNKNEINNINDSDLTIINLNNYSNNTQLNPINNKVSNDHSKVLGKNKPEIKEEKQTKTPVQKSKSINKNQALNNKFIKKDIKQSNLATPARSLEISKSKLKHLFKKERGDKDIFTHLYDTRNDTKAFRENYSKEIFSQIYTFKPNIIDSNSLDKNYLNLNNKKEENKEKFYKRLSDSRRFNHIFNKKLSNKLLYKNFISSEKNCKRIINHNNSNTEQNTLTINKQEKFHSMINNNNNKEKYNKNCLSVKKPAAYQKKISEKKINNLFILDTYSSLSSRLNSENKNTIPCTDRNENTKSTIFKKIMDRSKSRIMKNTPVSQSITYYETNLINSEQKQKPNFLLSLSKSNEKNNSLINENVNRKIIYSNKSENLSFNSSKEKFDSECESPKYDLPLQTQKNNSGGDKGKQEAKIINISLNEFIENENNFDGDLNRKDGGIFNKAENLNFMAADYYSSRNQRELKELIHNKNPNYYTSDSNNGNERNNLMFLDRLNISKENYNINSLNGGSYIDARKNKEYNNDNNNTNGVNETFIVHKTFPNDDLNKNQNEQSSSDRNNNKHNLSSFRSFKAKFVENKVNNENMKIREIKQEEYLNKIVDELNENRVKQENLMIRKYNQSLKKIKMNQLNEIYETTVSNLNELGKLREIGISNFIIEHLIYPFLNLVYNQKLSLNFNDFAIFANQTLDALSNEVQ